MSVWAKYLGIPWEEGADGPASYDCMSFTRLIQATHFGVHMDRIVVPNYDDGIEILHLINGCGERANWDQVPQPMHGDLVIVRRPIHIGVWLDEDGGGVLHCVRNIGAIFTPNAAWNVSGFGRRTYFRHRSKAWNTRP